MATIRSAEWLNTVLEEKNITSNELAEISNIPSSKISKIVSSENIGSIDDWNKIIDVLNIKEPKLSVSCEDVIEQLEDVIEDYEDIGYSSDEWELHLYYYEKQGCIIFYDYLTNFEIEEDGIDEDLKDKSYIIVTAKEALEYFKNQNCIL